MATIDLDALTVGELLQLAKDMRAKLSELAPLLSEFTGGATATPASKKPDKAVKASKGATGPRSLFACSVCGDMHKATNAGKVCKRHGNVTQRRALNDRIKAGETDAVKAEWLASQETPSDAPAPKGKSKGKPKA